MQHLVDEIYEGSLKDMRKNVSRFEYETREARNKIDIAELYMELRRVKQGMKDLGVELPEEPVVEREENVLAVLREDRKRMEADLADSIYYMNQLAKENKTLAARVSRWGTEKIFFRSKLNKNVKKILKQKEDSDLVEEVLASIPKS